MTVFRYRIWEARISSVFSECRVPPPENVAGTRELGWRAVTGSQRRALVGVPVFLPSVGRFVALLVFRITLELVSLKGVTNRWDGEAESQWIVAARLLYHLQYLVPYLSRLQRIHLPDRLKLNAKHPRRDVPPARGSSRHMLLGAHVRPY